MKKDIINLLLENLENYEGIKGYGCDLAYKLLECYNVDGSILYNTYKTIEWLKDNIQDIYDFLPSYKFEFGDEEYAKLCIDILENPEKAMVKIVLAKADEILSKLKFIQDNWNNGIILNNKTINIIKEELESGDF